MRKIIAGPLKVRRGQTVHFFAELGKSTQYAFIQIYSAMYDYEPSPHVPANRIHSHSGKPALMGTPNIRLSGVRPSHQLTFEAHEDCRFYLMQEVDYNTDPLAKGRMWKDGRLSNALFALRRFLGAQRWLRRRKDESENRL